MSKFTILLLRPDYMADTFGQDTYLAQVEAASVDEALDLARGEAVTADGINPDDCLYADQADYHPLITLNGWHDDVTKR